MILTYSFYDQFESLMSAAELQYCAYFGKNSELTTLLAAAGGGVLNEVRPTQPVSCT
jgi:hypothetical protein